MLNDGNKFHRHSIRLPGHDYSLPGIYFITVCIKDRGCLLGAIENRAMRLSESGVIVNSNWRIIPQRFPGVHLDEYVVMPNHIHGIIIIKEHDSHVGTIHELPLRMRRRKMTLPKIVGYFKMNTSRQINQIQGTSGHAIWQRNYHEHIIRNEKSLHRIREYIHSNPSHWSIDNENPECVGRSNRMINVGAIHELPLQVNP